LLRVARNRLAKMQGESVVIQTIYRGYATRAKIKEAQRKMLEGAKVDVVYRRGTIVSGCHLFLSVKRCGLSWKFIGRSEHHMDTFYGYVYREQTMEILAEHNRKCKEQKERLKEEHRRDMKIKYEGWEESKESVEQQSIHMMQDFMKGKKKDEDPLAELKAWQYDKVLQVLLKNLALVDPIKACSFDLQKQEGKMVLICNPILGKNAGGHGILKFAGQRRILNDQRRAIRRYDKNLKKKRMQEESLGLPLTLY